MHGGGGGLFAQGLKAHTMIGLVATAERYGHKESRVVCSISYPTVAFVHLNFVLRIAKHNIPLQALSIHVVCAPKICRSGTL